MPQAISKIKKSRDRKVFAPQDLRCTACTTLWQFTTSNDAEGFQFDRIDA